MHDVLDFFQIVFAQLHATEWLMLKCCYVSLHLVLTKAKEDYLDITIRKFLATYSICPLPKDIYHFQSQPNWKLVNFMVRCSNANHW